MISCLTSLSTPLGMLNMVPSIIKRIAGAGNQLQKDPAEEVRGSVRAQGRLWRAWL